MERISSYFDGSAFDDSVNDVVELLSGVDGKFVIGIVANLRMRRKHREEIDDASDAGDKRAVLELVRESGRHQHERFVHFVAEHHRVDANPDIELKPLSTLHSLIIRCEVRFLISLLADKAMKDVVSLVDTNRSIALTSGISRSRKNELRQLTEGTAAAAANQVPPFRGNSWLEQCGLAMAHAAGHRGQGADNRGSRFWG